MAFFEFSVRHLDVACKTFRGRFVLQTCHLRHGVSSGGGFSAIVDEQGSLCDEICDYKGVLTRILTLRLLLQ